MTFLYAERFAPNKQRKETKQGLTLMCMQEQKRNIHDGFQPILKNLKTIKQRLLDQNPEFLL